MILLILPNDIDLSNVDGVIIWNTGIYQIVVKVGVAYEAYDEYGVADEDGRRVNEWLFHHMDDATLHKLCHNFSITTKHIIEYLNKHGNESALATDPYHGMTPLHMLLMNPHAPPDSIAALLNIDMESAFCFKGSSCWTMRKITMLADWSQG